MERDLEPERVVVVDHPAAAVGEDPALGRSAAERLDDLLDVEAGLDGEDDALGDAEVGAGEDDLVDGLDRLAGTDRADVGDGLAQRGEDRPRALDVLARRRRRRSSASPSGRPRCRPTPGHRPSQAALAQPRGEVPAARRRDRRAVDDERAGAGALDDAGRAEEDGLDVGRVRDADHDDLGVGDRRRRGRGDRDAEVRELGARPGVRFQAVTGKPARARLAAIAAPIVPRPRNATFVWSGLVMPFRSDLCGWRCRTVGGVAGGVPAVSSVSVAVAGGSSAGGTASLSPLPRAMRNAASPPISATRMMIPRRPPLPESSAGTRASRRTSASG